MSRTERLTTPQVGFVIASNDHPRWKFVVITALAIVLIACALGWATFQSGPGGWTPLGAVEGAVVDQ